MGKVWLLLLLIVFAPVVFSAVNAQTTATPYEKQIGVTPCTNAAASADFDTLAQCTSTDSTSGTFQKAPIFAGKVTSPPYAATTCDSNKAGMIQWTGTYFQGCDGSSWVNLGGTTCSHTSDSELFTSTGTWTPPSTVSATCPLAVRVLLVGGGGGGGGWFQSGTNANSGGGGGSGYVQTQTLIITSTAGIPVTVGTAGAGTAVEGATGGSGTSSAFNNVIVSGGSGGRSAQWNYGGGAGGSGGGTAGAPYVGTLPTNGGSNGASAGSNGGAGQGNFIFSYTAGYTNAVLKLVYNSATFSVGSGGAAGSGDQAGGGGGGGLFITGTGPSGTNGGHATYCGKGGTGYGAGGGGGCYTGSSYGGGNGADGFVYVEW